MIGEFFKSNKTLRCEEHFFIEDRKYKLENILEVGSYILYIFDNGNIFDEYIDDYDDDYDGDYQLKFKDVFSSIREERVKTVNKLLYES